MKGLQTSVSQYISTSYDCSFAYPSQVSNTVNDNNCTAQTMGDNKS